MLATKNFVENEAGKLRRWVEDEFPSDCQFENVLDRLKQIEKQVNPHVTETDPLALFGMIYTDNRSLRKQVIDHQNDIQRLEGRLNRLLEKLGYREARIEETIELRSIKPCKKAKK